MNYAAILSNFDQARTLHLCEVAGRTEQIPGDGRPNGDAAVWAPGVVKPVHAPGTEVTI